MSANIKWLGQMNMDKGARFSLTLGSVTKYRREDLCEMTTASLTAPWVIGSAGCF